MKIVVVGGTGLIGLKVVDILRSLEHDVVVAAPSVGINTISGEGLDAALKGAQIVIDVSNSPSFEDEASMAFFKRSGTNLITAAAAAGIKHHVALGIVGTDQLQDSGYFRAKLTQESLVRNSSIPYTLVRATQFLEFVRGIAQSATDGDTITLPYALIQPIAAEDVASAVVDIALTMPINGIVEVAGPNVLRLDELVRQVLGHDKDRRNVIADLQARYFGIPLDERTLLPAKPARLGTTSLDAWLTQGAPRHES
jgi:uncharacterized protein YbjT (DUF2867 family)